MCPVILVFTKGFVLWARSTEEKRVIAVFIYRGEAVFEANQFADMSPQEFADTILMRRRSVPQHSRDK